MSTLFLLSLENQSAHWFVIRSISRNAMLLQEDGLPEGVGSSVRDLSLLDAEMRSHRAASAQGSMPTLDLAGNQAQQGCQSSSKSCP